MDSFFLAIIFFALGVVFGKRLRPTQAASPPPAFVPCPYCGEPVRHEANVCRTCHRTLSKASAAGQS